MVVFGVVLCRGWCCVEGGVVYREGLCIGACTCT